MCTVVCYVDNSIHRRFAFKLHNSAQFNSTIKDVSDNVTYLKNTV